MNTSPSATVMGRVPMTTRRQGIDRWFYVCVTLLIVGVNVVSFGPSLVAPSGRTVPLPLTTLVAAHSMIAAAFLLVFLTQAMLVATGRTAVHRRLGIGGVLLAMALVVTGMFLVIEEARRGFDLSGDLVPRGKSQDAGTTLALVFVFLLFGLLVAGAAWYRRRPEVHKRLMLLALVGPLLNAPLPHLVGHWDALRPWAGVILGCSSALALAVLPIYDRLSRGRIHPVSLWGAISVFAWVIVALGVVAPAPAWRQFAEWLVR